MRLIDRASRRLYSNGKTHAIIYICLVLGSIAFGLTVWRHDSSGLGLFLAFLTGMSGVQASRSVMSDKINGPQPPQVPPKL